jgi:hypothetical protein
VEEKIGAILKALLYQTEFHADEYRDETIFSFEQRELIPGIIARFEATANEIRKLLELLENEKPG